MLDSRGAQLFGDVTTRNVGRNLAIVLDGDVQSAPVIREPITGGRGQITGRFDVRGGAGPRERAAQRRAAGAADAAGGAHGRAVARAGLDPRRARFSFVVGSLAVFLFMLVYYRGGGVDRRPGAAR